MKLKLHHLVIFIMFFLPSQTFGAIDQTYVERILKENREYIEFINIGLSNFSNEKKADLHTIYQKHFNAEVAFLQGEYKRAFDNIYDSQKDMVTLYEYILRMHYLEDSKRILDDLAPKIIRSKNPQARKYLTLGYRDRTVARTFVLVGEASHPRLYSYKIFKYVEAIKMCRRAKRYGFLALYTGQKIDIKRKIFNEMLKGELKEGSLFFGRFIDKPEKEYIAEMRKDFETFEKEHYASQKSDKTTETENKVDKNSEGKVKEQIFEKRVERRVRYRKERRLALYLLNGEFEKGEPLIRFYVEDYIFKLVSASLRIISDGGDHKEANEQNKGLSKYRIHHKDNYSYLAKDSLLDEIQKTVRVIDEVKSEDKSKEGEKTVKDSVVETPKDKTKSDVNVNKEDVKK